MAALFGLSSNSHAGPEGLVWKFNEVTRDFNGIEKKQNITYSVNSDITKIEDAKEIIYIDYSNYNLYRYARSNRSCQKFILNSGNEIEPLGTKEILKKRSLSLISSLKVFTTDERKELANYNCSLKHAMFGADLAMLQMVAAPAVYEFGQKFTESMVGYYVSNDVTGLDSLFNIAQKRSDVFKNNSLLRQIDIIGLLEVLDGFPVQFTRKFHDTVSRTTLLKNPTPAEDRKLFLLPDECRE
ncbi:MAG: hypothetical protein ACN4GR_12165 [Arenicellales bacterium]